MLTINSTILRALCVFTHLNLTYERGIIITILKDLTRDNTASDLQSRESDTRQCHRVGVTSSHPAGPDSNQYGWVPLSSYSTFLPSLHSFMNLTPHHPSGLISSQFPSCPFCMAQSHQSLVSCPHQACDYLRPWHVHFLGLECSGIPLFTKLNPLCHLCLQLSQVLRGGFANELVTHLTLPQPICFLQNTYHNSACICFFRHCLCLKEARLMCYCCTPIVQCSVLYTVDA